MSFAHRVSAVVINLSGAGLWTISKSATRGQSRCFGFTFGNLWRGPSPLTVFTHRKSPMWFTLNGLSLVWLVQKSHKSCRFHSGCRSVKEELLFSRVATLSRVSLCVVVMCGGVFSDLMSFPSDQLSSVTVHLRVQIRFPWRCEGSLPVNALYLNGRWSPFLVNMCVKEQTLWFWTLFEILMRVRPTRSGTRRSKVTSPFYRQFRVKTETTNFTAVHSII